MGERFPKGILIALAAILGSLLLAYLAYSRPGYFTSQTYLGGLLLVECLIAAVWMYRRVFFPIIIISFLLAGVDLPVGTVWTMARWLVLGVGALVGSAVMLKDRRHHFGLFHVVALFAILAALASAAVSRYTNFSLLKVLSLLLLFIYTSTGARLAVIGREDRFFAGLITGCEIFVGIIAGFYFVGIEAMGNPNSLGLVMGVAAAPILLWGVFISQTRFSHHRRLVLYAISMYLTFASHSRASMVVAFLASVVFCLALRRYRLLGQGIALIVILATASAIFRPEAFSRSISALTSTVVYKGKDPRLGVLSSRASPWQDAVESIQKHFWFGTGFGTSDTGQDATADVGKFASTSAVSTEHGSSYLAITTWVGMLGVLPFFLLVLILFRRVVATIMWMVRTGNPLHAAIPLSIVILAGMIHAGLEDWMFAPGNYLCVFYWSMAFIFVDQAPELAVTRPSLGLFLPVTAVGQGLGDVATTR